MKTDAYTKVLLTIIAAGVLVMVARMYESPAPVSAQKAAVQAAQHVIVDGVQHVVIDDIGTTMSSRGLPVSLKTDSLGRNTTHVIIDDVAPGLSLTGLPVSVRPQSSGVGIWQYDLSDCSSSNLTIKGALGWELVEATLEPNREITFNMKSGRGEIGQVPSNSPAVDKASLCYFKKQVGR